MSLPIMGFIVDTVTLDPISFECFEPPQESITVGYDDTIVRGRSEPHVFYSHTDAASWSFTIYLAASVNQGDNGRHVSVMEKKNFIKSLAYPDYGQVPGMTSGVVKSPHLARVHILRMFDVVGTIRDVSFTYQPPYDIYTGYPQIIVTTFSLKAQRKYPTEKPLGYAEVRRLTIKGQTRQV